MYGSHNVKYLVKFEWFNLKLCTCNKQKMREKKSKIYKKHSYILKHNSYFYKNTSIDMNRWL